MLSSLITFNIIILVETPYFFNKIFTVSDFSILFRTTFKVSIILGEGSAISYSDALLSCTIIFLNSVAKSNSVQSLFIIG